MDTEGFGNFPEFSCHVVNRRAATAYAAIWRDDVCTDSKSLYSAKDERPRFHGTRAQFLVFASTPVFCCAVAE